MARLSANVLQPHLKQGAQIDANDFMLFPDDAHELPDDVGEQEKRWMLKLNRSA